MKTPEQALVEWANDEIVFHGFRVGAENVSKFKRSEMVKIAQAIRGDNKDIVINPDRWTTGAYRAEKLIDWMDACNVRWMAESLGIKITAHWLIRFGSLYEAYLTVMRLHAEMVQEHGEYRMKLVKKRRT